MHCGVNRVTVGKKELLWSQEGTGEGFSVGGVRCSTAAFHKKLYLSL